jgi:hypothetical protein
MSTTSFYFKTIRKINSAFASLFNNIILVRYNPDGTEDQRITVPIIYGDREKYIKRLEGDPELYKKIQIQLPIMSYILNGFSYDAQRKLNTTTRNFAPSGSNETAFSQYNPVPYDFNFVLTIYTRNVEDGNQILEQILPYFTKDYSLKLNLVPEMGITKTVPIILDSVQQMIDADGPFSSEVRTVMWTLQFTVKGFIFGAIKEVPIITQNANNNGGVIINMRTDSGTGINAIDDFSGVCCEGNPSRSFIMSADCPKDYRPREIVYQGISLDNAYASGRVYNWSNTTNELMIYEICGDFKVNQPITGFDSLATKMTLANAANSIVALQITTVPEPPDATANSCFNIVTTAEEYPDFPL